MLLKTIIDEDFNNYKLPSIFIGTCYCDWKCPSEQGLPISICQNQPLAQQPNIEYSIESIYNRYISNPITQAVVVGGLEPMLQFENVLNLIKYFREYNCNDDIVIYTGYYPHEIQDKIDKLKQYKNIIIKFGRFIPNQNPHFDSVLGVNLASDNQYAERIG